MLPAASLLALQMAAPPGDDRPAIFALLAGKPRAALAAAVPAAEVTATSAAAATKLFGAPPAFGGCAVASREASITDAVPALRGGGAAARAVVVVKGHKGHSLLAIAVRCLADIGAAAGLDLLGARYVYVPAAGLDAPISLDSALPPGAPALALLVGGAADVSDRLQSLAGAVDPKLAKRTDPGSWRADLGEDRLQNAVAVCRSAAGASRAAAFFFGGRLASAAAAPHALLRCAVHAPVGAAFVVAPPAALEPLLAELGAAAFTLHAAARAPAQSLEALVGAGALAAAGAEVVLLLVAREALDVHLKGTLGRAGRAAGGADIVSHPATASAAARLVGADAAAAVGAEGTVVSAASVGAPVELIAHLGFLRKSALF